MKTNGQHPGRGWMKRRDLADALGITLRYLERALQPALDPKHVKADGAGKPTWLFAPAVAALWRESARPPGAPPEVSDGLERARQAKARLAEIEVERAEGKLLDAACVNAALAELASLFRRTAERLRPFPSALAAYEQMGDDWAEWVSRQPWATPPGTPA